MALAGIIVAVASVIVAVVALLVSSAVARKQMGQERHSTQAAVLIDLLQEHRCAKMAAARRFVYRELGQRDLSHGMDSLPETERELVRDLMCFYDILGVIVAYDVIDVDPVVDQLGGSVIDMWSALAPLIATERSRRGGQVADPGRWHCYFEQLASSVKVRPPVRRIPAAAS